MEIVINSKEAAGKIILFAAGILVTATIYSVVKSYDHSKLIPEHSEDIESLKELIAAERLREGTLTSESLRELIVERGLIDPSPEFTIYEERTSSNCFEREADTTYDVDGNVETVQVWKTVDCEELKEK